MKKISIIAGLAALTALFTGCIKEEAPATPEAPEVKMVEITLSTDSYPVIGGVETKTQLVGTAVHWKTGDMIKVNAPTARNTNGSNYGDGKPSYYLTNISADGVNAKFVGSVPQEFVDNGKLALMYPYVPGTPDDYNRLKGAPNGNYTNHLSNYHFPSAEQGLEAGSFGKDANLSFANIDLNAVPKETLKFKNAAGLYEFKLKGDANVTKVVITNTDQNIAKTDTYDSGANIFYSIDGDTFKYEYNKGLNSKSVTLTNEMGIQLGEEAISFYACVAPVKTVASCTIDVYTKDDLDTPVFSTTVSNVGIVEPGKIRRLGEFEVLKYSPLYFRPSRAWADEIDGKDNDTDVPTNKTYNAMRMNENIAAYLTAEGKEPILLSMTDADRDGVYVCEVPDTYTNVTFAKMSSAEYTDLSDAIEGKTVSYNGRPVDENKVFVMNEQGNGGEWVEYVPATVVYYKPNSYTKGLFEEGKVQSYWAFFRAFTIGSLTQVATQMELVGDGIYKVTIGNGTTQKYPQVGFYASYNGDWQQYWVKTTVVDIPLDGRNIFIADEDGMVNDGWSHFNVDGTWSTYTPAE